MRPTLSVLGLLAATLAPTAVAQSPDHPRPVLDAHPAWVAAYHAAWAADVPFRTGTDAAFATLFDAYGAGRTAALDALYAADAPSAPLPDAVSGPAGYAPPFLPWIEDRRARLRGDTTRVRRVLPVLVRHYAAWERARCRPDAGCHAAPADVRPGDDPGADAVGATAALGLGAQRLAALADRLGDRALARDFRLRALRRRIYLDTHHAAPDGLRDRRADSLLAPTAHADAFWALALGSRHADALVAAAEDPGRFARPGGLAADAGPDGPLAPAALVYVAAYGLRGAGRDDVARALAERYFTAGPRPADGLVPVGLLLEDVLGLDVDGERGVVKWRMRPGERHGVEGLRLGAGIVSLVATPAPDGALRVDVEADRPFALVLWHGRGEARLDVPAGRSTFEAPPPR